MSYWRLPLRGDLPDGAYERLIDDALARALENLGAGRNSASRPVSDDLLSTHLARALHDAALLTFREARQDDDGSRRIALARDLLSTLRSAAAPLEADETRLRAELLDKVWTTRTGGQSNEPETPRDSLAGTRLIVNRRNENVLSSLASEFDSADEVDLLCSFVKRSGVRKLLDRVRAFVQRGRKMRVLSTTYLGASEVEALEALASAGVEVRLSYDEDTTRLHAKAWLFRRHSGFHTAYVGSSNLSHAAMTDGLEWNVRLSALDAPQVIDRFAALFASYWDDPAVGFEAFDPERARRALAAARRRGVATTVPADERSRYALSPLPHQQRMLAALEQARALDKRRSLLVAATGTGKTMVAAFDFARLFRAGAVKSLLFVAHRDEILEQSRRTFRDVSGVEGEVLTGTKKPAQDRFLFATNLTLKRLADDGLLQPEAWDYVVIDEVHHAAADSYEALLALLRPRYLLGLTATPERADGQSIEQHFDRPAVADLRVWDAIDDQLLVPFSYFAVDDEAVGNLRELQWRRGGYSEDELTARILSAKDAWVEQIVRALNKHLVHTPSMRALAFCVGRAHARYVAERLEAHGIPARAITHGEVAPDERAEAIRALRSDAPDRPRVLCAVDVFNEGVDIPEIDTVLMLRPTDSATVFLQQLGRGLRRAQGKDSLTVLDFVAHQHEKFRIDRRYAALLGVGRAQLRRAVQEGFPFLPAGCALQLTPRTQRQVLDAIRRSIGNNGPKLVEALREQGPDTTLEAFLDGCGLEVRDLYDQKRSFYSLRRDAGFAAPPLVAGEADTIERVQRLVHADDAVRLDLWAQLAASPEATLQTEGERRLLRMLFAILYGPGEALEEEATRARWKAQAALRAEVAGLAPVLRARSDLLRAGLDAGTGVPLVGHAHYLTEEIAAAFDVRGGDGRGALYAPQAGVVRHGSLDLLLVTIDKSGKAKTPHLQYEDRALSLTEFQWQSQARTTQDHEHGRRHWDHVRLRVTPQLFVREDAKDERGLAVGYCWLGPLSHLRHEGERPITVVWRLAAPMPERLYRDLRPAA